MNTNKKNNAPIFGGLIKKSVFAGSLIVIIIAILGLFGYIPGLGFLGSIRSDYIPMAPSTAISFLLLSIILIMHTLDFLRRRIRFFAALIPAVVAIFGFIKWIEYYASVETSFEESIIRVSGKIGDIPIGIMSPSTGALFFLSGIIMILLIFQKTWGKYTIFFGHSTGILGSILFVSSLIFMIAYLYGQPLLYDLGKTVPMAITTAIAFLFLGIALISTVGVDYSPLLFFSGPSIKSRILRIFVPLITLIIFVINILTKIIQNIFEINDALIMGLLVVFFTVLSGFIIFRLGHSIGNSLDKAQEEISNIAKFPSENPNPVMRIKEGGKIIYSNRPGTNLIKSLELKVGSKTPKILYDTVIRLFREKNSKSELLNIQINDEVYEFIINPVSGTDYANLYGRNVTERNKILEMLKTSNTELQQFAYVASHDLQEPLRIIVSYVQLLARKYKDKLDSDANDYMGFIEDRVTRMQNMINDLLVFSRVSTRAKSFKKSSLEELLDDAISNLEILIKERGATIKMDKLPTVSVDPSQFIRVFQNLIENAIKFRGKEPLIINIKAQKERDRWRVSVTDNGIGIESQYFDRIFEIFQTLHPKDKYPGTGIGLAICKRIIERHGGKIWLESKFGEGTTFYFTIPIKKG